VASNWAAERVGKSLKEFQWLSGSPLPASTVRENPLNFSGEMIFPFFFDTFPGKEHRGGNPACFWRIRQDIHAPETTRDRISCGRPYDSAFFYISIVIE
jgi:hypothetical protein